MARITGRGRNLDALVAGLKERGVEIKGGLKGIEKFLENFDAIHEKAMLAGEKEKEKGVKHLKGALGGLAYGKAQADSKLKKLAYDIGMGWVKLRKNIREAVGEKKKEGKSEAMKQARSFLESNQELLARAREEDQVLGALGKLPKTYHVFNGITLVSKKPVKMPGKLMPVTSADANHAVVGPTGIFFIDLEAQRDKRDLERVLAVFVAAQEGWVSNPFEGTGLLVGFKEGKGRKVERPGPGTAFKIPIDDLQKTILKNDGKLLPGEINLVSGFFESAMGESATASRS